MKKAPSEKIARSLEMHDALFREYAAFQEEKDFHEIYELIRSYHAHWWGNVLARSPETPLSFLCPDDPWQVEYPVAPDSFVPIHPSQVSAPYKGGIASYAQFLFRKTMASAAMKIGKRIDVRTGLMKLLQHTNAEEAFGGEKGAALQSTLKSHSVVIAMNHPSWLNFPLVALHLQQLNIATRNDIHILLGPALTHNTQSKAVPNALAHLIKTIPPTARSKVDGWHELQNTISRQAMKHVHHVMQRPGTVLLVCPSGTTDAMVHDSNGNVNACGMCFDDENHHNTAQRFLAFLNKRYPVLPIGCWNDIYSGNTTVHRGHEVLSLGNLTPAKAGSGLELMHEITEHIYSEAGAPIGALFMKDAHGLPQKISAL